MEACGMLRKTLAMWAQQAILGFASLPASFIIIDEGALQGTIVTIATNASSPTNYTGRRRALDRSLHVM